MGRLPTVARKAWGYAAERTPSTHPVAGRQRSTRSRRCRTSTGSRTPRGRRTLRQLIAHIGDDAFIAGVAAYLREHAFGNGTLADFLGAIERASGRELTAWSRAWLLTAGVDVISVDRETGVVESCCAASVSGRPRRTFDVAGYGGGVEESSGCR